MKIDIPNNAVDEIFHMQQVLNVESIDEVIRLSLNLMCMYTHCKETKEYDMFIADLQSNIVMKIELPLPKIGTKVF